jgi:hypothetical protein
MLHIVFAAATSATAAAIPTGPVTAADELEAPHRLRSGAVVGFAVGATVFGASGYPNDVTKIGDPAQYAASGFMLGSSETLFVMGALADYLNFGFWYAHAAASNRDFVSSGDGGGLRVEIFPLIGYRPRFAGLGLLGQFGVGIGSLSLAKEHASVSEGTQSFIAAGAFYEWSFGHFLGGHIEVGPSLEYDAIFSLAFERHGLVASARLAFCGGP